MLFAAAALYDQVHARVAEHGVFVLPRPIPRDAIFRGLNWMTAARERLRGYEKKVRPIEEKMEEIRLVNRAKWLLISELKMSEPDAHHYITRQAMDRCVSKRWRWRLSDSILKRPFICRGGNFERKPPYTEGACGVSGKDTVIYSRPSRCSARMAPPRRSVSSLAMDSPRPVEPRPVSTV